MDLEAALDHEARIQAELMTRPGLPRGLRGLHRRSGRRASTGRRNEDSRRTRPSSRTGTARSARAGRAPSASEHLRASRPTTSPSPPGAPARSCAALAERAASCAARCRRPTAPWTCARWWPCARASPTSRRSPTPPSRCRGSARTPVSRAGTDVQKNRWLPAVARGDVLCAFAVTEPEAGSDLAGVRTRADRATARSGGCAGVKTFISNAGIAGLYTVLARTGDGATTHRGLSMFLVDAEAPGHRASSRWSRWPPHPLGEVRFDGHAGRAPRRGGQGLRAGPGRPSTPSGPAWAPPPAAWPRAPSTRPLRWAQARRQFGRPLADFQATQMALAEMQVELAGARGCWCATRPGCRTGARSGSRAKAPMAKLFATETAQRVVDRARADPRRPGRDAGRDRGAPLPRGARAADLRGHQRDPEARDRAPDAEGEQR